MSQLTVRETGITIGNLPPGKNNKISDVKGVLVGHCTVDTKDQKTGVTVILPSVHNPFTHKLISASYVLNGFGKTQGLVQIDELGTLETPIALTNTLNVGLVHNAIVSYMLDTCRKSGIQLSSVNPVVGECNDAGLNKIADRVVQEAHVLEAIESACADFPMGDVGAGKGTICFGLKGGIGSSSREIQIENNTYTIGALVQSNHGIINDLVVKGKPIGQQIKDYIEKNTVDKGSIIIIIATDLPVSSRQLKRIIKRSSVGLARTGSFIGHGSGEIVVGFSTANVLTDDEPIHTIQMINETYMDVAFRGVAEAVEEAILNSLFTAETVTGYGGKVVRGIRDFLDCKNGEPIFKDYYDL